MENNIESKLSSNEIYRLTNIINEFNKNMESNKNKEIEGLKLQEEFVQKFTIKKIEKLTIDEYVLGKESKDSFCYWVEYKTKSIGNISGGSDASNKFLIYYNQKGKRYEINNKLSHCIRNPQSEIKILFKKLKLSIINLILDGNSKNAEGILNSVFPPVVKSKILYLYYPNKYLRICSKTKLDHYLNCLGIEYNEKDNFIDKQEKLMQWRNNGKKTKNWSNFIFSEFLLNYFPDIKSQNKQEQSEDLILNLNISSKLNTSQKSKKTVKFEYKGIKKNKVSVKIQSNAQNITYPRDENVSINALCRANYKCEIDPNHKTFMRKKSNLPYTEAHHLVPLSKYEYFKYSLDVEENVVSLCSNCHNQIHYGKDADTLLFKLFKDRENKLKSVGIDITFEELKKMYNIE